MGRCKTSLKAIRGLYRRLLAPNNLTFGFHEDFEPEQEMYMARVALIIGDSFIQTSKQSEYMDHECKKARFLMGGGKIYHPPVGGEAFVQSLDLDMRVFGMNAAPLMTLWKRCCDCTRQEFLTCLNRVKNEDI